MKLPRGHTPRVTADGKVEVHRHDEEKLARGGFGERMLRSLGWRDGDGLGVGRQGRAEAVRVTQKLDNKGVGANKASAPSTDWGDAWWERTFDQGAKKHKAGGDGSSSSSSSDDDVDDDSDSDDSDSDVSTSSSSSSSESDSSSSDSSDSDSDKKSKKKKKKTATRHRDGTVTSATKAEMRIARQLARDPWGRFGGRDGKMARVARMEAEAAAKANAALNETLGEEKASAAPSSEKKEKEKKKEEKKTNEEVEVKKKAKKAAPLLIPPPISVPEAPATPSYEVPAGWWGTSLFVHAGRLEGILDAKEKEKGKGTRGFTDADQEALAERTTALKAAGKRGLGASSSSKKEGKAAGHDWKGSKVVFGDDDGEEEEEKEKEKGGGGDGDGERAAKKQKKEKKKEKKKKTSSPSLNVSSLKWKKAVESALSGDSNKKKGLSVSKLASRVAEALSAKVETSSSKEQLETALNGSLLSLCGSSSRFEVDGKGRVKLASK